MRLNVLSSVFLGFLLACGGAGKSGKVASTSDTAGKHASGEHAVESYRLQQPKPSEPRSFQLPQIKQFDLDGVLSVYLVEDHSLPTVSLNVVMEGGSINDSNGKEGTASICMDLVSEGTKKLDKISLQEALADIGSRIGSSASTDTQRVSMASLSKNFPRTFELFSDIILEPGLRKSDFERIVETRKGALKQRKGSAGGVSSRVWRTVAMGQGHPLGKVSTEKSFEMIRQSDCLRYHQGFVKPKGAKLFVVGDIDEAAVRKHFGGLLKKWRGAPKSSTKIAAPSPASGRVFFVDVPGSAQSSIMLVHGGPERAAEDYFHNQMMINILGGGFSSRINMNLREDKGYSYGARGGFAYFRNYFGLFYASSSVRSDATIQSVLEIANEIRALHDGSRVATSDELKREQNGAILGLPAKFATSKDVLGRYRDLVYYNLPLDYYNSYVGNVSSVSLEQVSEAARKQLKPEDLRILVVGDGSARVIHRNSEGKDVPFTDSKGREHTVLSALKELAAGGTFGKGEVIVLDTDGKIAR